MAKVKLLNTNQLDAEILASSQKFVDHNFSDAYDFLNRYQVFSEWFEKKYGYFTKQPDFELL